jgi:hypothetical protein
MTRRAPGWQRPPKPRRPSVHPRSRSNAQRAARSAAACLARSPSKPHRCSISEPAAMAFLPFWPKTATTLYNLLAFCAFWSFAAVGMATVGGSTAKWVRSLGCIASFSPPPQRLSALPERTAGERVVPHAARRHLLQPRPVARVHHHALPRPRPVQLYLAL